MKKAEKYAKRYLSLEIREIQLSGRVNVLQNLSIYEKALIYKYTNDGFEELNEKLRVSYGYDISEFGKLLLNALSKLPDFKGLTYRCAELTTNELNKYIEAFDSNHIIVEPTSFSF